MSALDQPSLVETINPRIPVAAGYYCETVAELLAAYTLLGRRDVVVKPVYGAAGKALWGPMGGRGGRGEGTRGVVVKPVYGASGRAHWLSSGGGGWACEGQARHRHVDLVFDCPASQWAVVVLWWAVCGC